MDALTAADPESPELTAAAATAEPGRIALRDLTKRYGTDPDERPAVDAISLDIEPGEFVTLLGPSGCGKTTTLRMIAGFETPTSGAIELDGGEIGRVPPNRRPMSMVFQSYALFPHLTVRENVSYGLKLKRTPAARMNEEVETVLTIMNIMALADRAPHQLSGGQQQRVALARALVMRPKVLLFDEPLSNLDAKLRVLMRKEIRRLQRRLGITSVFVTHDQDEAMTLSDRIVVMSQGRIEQVDVPEQVYRRPGSVFVADFIGRANFLDATVLAPPVDGRAQVAVLGHELATAHHPDVALDGDNLLVVRPEAVRLVREPDATEVGGPVGRVLNRIFHGESVEYEVETDSGTIVATVADPRPDEMFVPMDPVRVRFSEESCWLLPGETDGR